MLELGSVGILGVQDSVLEEDPDPKKLLSGMLASGLAVAGSFGLVNLNLRIHKYQA